MWSLLSVNKRDDPDLSQLGGGFGPGFKVAGGYDLVGNGCELKYSRQQCEGGGADKNTVWPIVAGDKVPDDDPEDQLGHGKSFKITETRRKADHI